MERPDLFLNVFLGGSMAHAPDCGDTQKALELFATFKSKLPFYPFRGKERVEQLFVKFN